MAHPAPQRDGDRLSAEAYFARRAEFEHTELIDGEVVEMAPTGWSHGRVEVRLGRLLDEHVETLGGSVVGGEVGYRLGPDLVRAADLAVHLERPETGRGWTTTPPDLVVEIVSPNDGWPAIERKIEDWLAFGVREVWVVDPEGRAVTIRRPDGSGTKLRGDVPLTSPVLPGFTAPLTRLFA